MDPTGSGNLLRGSFASLWPSALVVELPLLAAPGAWPATRREPARCGGRGGREPPPAEERGRRGDGLLRAGPPPRAGPAAGPRRPAGRGRVGERWARAGRERRGA